MRHLVRAVAAIGFALSTRRDLLLEILALRHQLRVLVRSNRRFRPSDRLLWLVLRRSWPRWRYALVLVQPAIVDRWHRNGLHRCWRRRSRRPGRPRIDSECRALIQRVAQENRLWGAPRIHGELLKLGIVVSERTGSRYLRGLPRGPSQTWRTFLVNHLAQFTFMSPEISPYAPGGDDVVDVFGRVASHQRAIADWHASLQRETLGKYIVQDHLDDRIAIRNGRCRDPPTPEDADDPRCVPGEWIGPHALDLCDDSVGPSVARGQSPSLSTSSKTHVLFGLGLHVRVGFPSRSENWRGTPAI